MTYEEINIGDILIASPDDKTYRYKVTRKNDRSRNVTVYIVEEYDSNLRCHIPYTSYGTYTVPAEDFCMKIRRKAVVL